MNTVGVARQVFSKSQQGAASRLVALDLDQVVSRELLKGTVQALSRLVFLFLFIDFNYSTLRLGAKPSSGDN